MKTDSMKRIFLVLAVSMAAFAFPFNEGMPKGSEYHPEMTREELAQQQVHNARVDQVGSAPARTGLEKRDPTYQPQHNASQTVALVQQREQSRQAMAAAQNRMQKQEAGNSNWLRIVIGVLIAGSLIWLGKRYIDESTPDAPKIKKKMTW